MPKLKTKSSVKKRFRLTATGKVVMKPAKMRHGLSNRPQSMKRKARRITVMFEGDARIVRPMMPYGR
jgi:large subunit ribosomal protein L35